MERHDIAKLIGANLIALRKAAKLTQEEFAAKAGVGRVTLTRWETGTRVPDLLVLPPMADALGITVGTLVKKILDFSP